MKKLFKNFVFALVLLFLVLSGCTADKTALNGFKSALKNDLSFKVSYEYMNLAVNGFSQTLEQSTAKDGGFTFINNFRQWDHPTEYEHTEKMEYFYRYEDGVFVCYMKKDGGEVSRDELSKKMEAELKTQKDRIISYNALFPSYLEGFKQKNKKYTFSLPLEKVLEDDSYLAAYITQVFAVSQIEYNPDWDVDIACTCITEKNTYKPIKISYDFEELKPYVLSSGALSGEAALDSEFMKLVYEFDYDIPQSIDMPDNFK